ncbi:MAG: type IX secretion system membrane protein PorP/SprF [Bacteroidota bacterium]
MKSFYYLLACVILICTQEVYGQQLSQFSQYLHNSILLNPATTGINDNLDINLSYRDQWAGFEDAPSTYYLSVDAVLFRMQKKSAALRLSRPGYTTVRTSKNRLKHGIGGYVIADNNGPFVKTSGYLTYALHTALYKKINISVGVALGMSNWKFDDGKIILTDLTDETYNYFLQDPSKSYLDFNPGIWLYSESFYIGYSSAQIFQNQIYSTDIPSEAKLNVHHFFTAGYQFKLNEDLALIPSFLIKYMRPTPVSYDFNLKLDYQKKIWGGFSYRHKDAIIGLIGFTISDLVSICYSYDYTLSGISNYTSGSHEIVLGIKLLKESKSTISFL